MAPQAARSPPPALSACAPSTAAPVRARTARPRRSRSKDDRAVPHRSHSAPSTRHSSAPLLPDALLRGLGEHLPAALHFEPRALVLLRRLVRLLRLQLAEALEARLRQRAGGDGGDARRSPARGDGGSRGSGSLRRAHSMSANAPATASPVSHSCSSRMPGVSIRMPPPGSSSSWRPVVVCRPRLSDSRTSRVRRRSSPSSALAIDDLPTPDDPSSAAVRPRAEVLAQQRSGSGRVAETACDRHALRERRRPRAPSPSGSSTRSALFRTMTGEAPLSHAVTQVALDAARIEVVVEAGDEEHDVDVGGDDLLLGGIAGGAAREPAEARQHGADARVAAGCAALEHHPVADRREIGAAVGGVTQPPGDAREALARRRQHAIDVRVLEADPRRARYPPARMRRERRRETRSSSRDRQSSRSSGTGTVLDRALDACRSAVYVSFSQQRSTSATLQACATQPRGRNGASASKISLIDPTHASLEMLRRSLRAARARRRDRPVHLQPRVDERADQPRPHRALVIRGVARAQIAVVRAL